MLESQANDMLEIHSWSEVPEFQNESDEANFWATHCLGDELLEQMEPDLDDLRSLLKSNATRKSEVK